MTNDTEVVHEWQALTKKLVSEGYDAGAMLDYVSMLPKPRMMKPRGHGKLEE